MSTRGISILTPELIAFDRTFFRLMDLARASVGMPEPHTMIGLIGLHLLADEDFRAETAFTPDARIDAEIKVLGDLIESSRPELKGVFTSALLIGLERIPDRILKEWWRDLSQLAAEKPARAAFGRWLTLRLSERSIELVDRRQIATPYGVARLMASLADLKNGNRVLDPSCGVGTLLATAIEEAEEKQINIWLYGQELRPSRWALCKLCVYCLGRKEAEVILGDALTVPAFTQNEGLGAFDRIVSDLPMGQRAWHGALPSFPLFDEMLRRSSLPAETLFVLHTLARLKPSGKAVLLVPQGFLFRLGLEARVREYLIAQKRLQAVIALPSKRIPSTAVEVALLVLGENKTDEVLFLDAAARDNPRFGQPDFAPELRAWIFDTLQSQTGHFETDIRRVPVEELASSDFSLLPRRYLPAHDAREQLNIGELRQKLKALNAHAQDASAEMDTLLDELKYTLSSVVLGGRAAT